MSTGWLLEEDLEELTFMRAVSMEWDHGGWTIGVNESEEISRASRVGHDWATEMNWTELNYHNREWLMPGMARKLTLVLIDKERHLYRNGVGLL